MFSEMYALADTFVSKTGAPVNTAVELACLVVPVNNKFALPWNNLRLFVQRAHLLVTSIFKCILKISRTQHVIQDLTGYVFRPN